MTSTLNRYAVVVQQATYKIVNWYFCVDSRANPYEATPKLLALAEAEELKRKLEILYPDALYKIVQVTYTEE